MTSPDKQSMILQPELERNIYSHQNTQQTKTRHADVHQPLSEYDRSRIETPYEAQWMHPYLRNKANNRNLSMPNESEHGNGNKSNEDKDASPELLFSKLNLNGFKLSNKQNESVNEWRNSIESQLNHARNQPTEIEQLCARIASTSGLGRTVLLAKLRKSLPASKFQHLCHALHIDAAP